jgi:hypothetical protein
MNTQPWEDSLAQVRALMDEYLLAPAGAELFEADEVPEFSDLDKYRTWRCQFIHFARSQVVPSSAFAIALERIARAHTLPNTAGFNLVACSKRRERRVGSAIVEIVIRLVIARDQDSIGP